MANKWITFLTKWAKDNNVNYRDAMKSPKAKADYNKSKGGEEVKKKKYAYVGDSSGPSPKSKAPAKSTAKYTYIGDGSGPSPKSKANAKPKAKPTAKSAPISKKKYTYIN